MIIRYIAYLHPGKKNYILLHYTAYKGRMTTLIRRTTLLLSCGGKCRKLRQFKIFTLQSHKPIFMISLKAHAYSVGLFEGTIALPALKVLITPIFSQATEERDTSDINRIKLLHLQEIW